MELSPTIYKFGFFSSGAEEIAKYINSHDHITCDVGQVGVKVAAEISIMAADAGYGVLSEFEKKLAEDKVETKKTFYLCHLSWKGVV